jgi:hypothetical protein
MHSSLFKFNFALNPVLSFQKVPLLGISVNVLCIYLVTVVVAKIVLFKLLRRRQYHTLSLYTQHDKIKLFLFINY